MVLREAGEVLCARASPDHPGLKEAADVVLNLIAAESHPAGQPVGLLCHSEPAQAPVRGGRTGVGHQAPGSKGLRQQLPDRVLARVARFRLRPCPVLGPPASQGGGPASRAASDLPQASGEEPQGGLQEGSASSPDTGQAEANHMYVQYIEGEGGKKC